MFVICLPKYQRLEGSCHLPQSLSPGLLWPHKSQSLCSHRQFNEFPWFVLYRPQLKVDGLSCLSCFAHSSFPSYSVHIRIQGFHLVVSHGVPESVQMCLSWLNLPLRRRRAKHSKPTKAGQQCAQ